MGWLYARRTVDSTKNGVLTIVKTFGKTAVIGDAVFQSGRYMQRVFARMLKMLPSGFVPKRILVVGLGAGGCIPVIQRGFPGVHIVALEYDEVMVELAKQTYLPESDVSGLELAVGDMRETLPRLQGTFDLILVDVFCGRRVAPALVERGVLGELERLLAWQGSMVVNLFEERSSVSPQIERVFCLHGIAHVKYNDIVLYRHYGMGKMGEGVPAGFQDREQSRTYLEATAARAVGQRVIGEPGALGLRTRFGPFVFDAFTCDARPDLSPIHAAVRIVSWQPYRGSAFQGWWRIPGLFTMHYKRGAAILGETPYWEAWSGHARRHREKFLKDPRLEIADVDLETFAAAYHATGALDRFTRGSFVRVLRYHLARHPGDVHLWVARERASGRVLSGLATIDYKDISQSTHVIAFVHPDAQRSSAGVGLIDHWHTHSRETGLRFLNFGLLRRPCDPRSWQGYTVFKRQFHLWEMLYPRPLWRVILPKRGVL